MCGIVGVLSQAVVEPERVEHMRDRLEHRGPDHAGLWRSDDGLVCFGHRRLSIIDLDVRSNQPMRSQDGRFTITFNGEIYNFRALREQLRALGAEFRTESDTEVLIEAYRHWGSEALNRLSGMYAFALWDAEAREVFCARDRAGEKPFYYARVGRSFVFASEPKAMLAWPELSHRVDYEAITDVLTLGYVADPKCIWADMKKLPPAHSMVVEFPKDERPRVRQPVRYWSFPIGATGPAPSAEELRETLLGAADEMAVSDVPLGAFLSGGVDSSSVVAALSLSGREVRTFTIGFEDPAYDERRWAARVAELYRTSHVERTVEQSDVMSFASKMPWHYDEPFADYSCFPTYHLCRKARQSITVALSGDGADEIFAGYRKYQRLSRRLELRRTLPVPVARMLAKVASLARPEGDHLRRTLRQYGLRSSAMLADMLCVGFSLPLLGSVAAGPLAESLRHYDPERLVEELLRQAPVSEVGLLNAMRHLDFALTLPGDMLVKVDRASMAVSLEARPLFLHKDVMELAARVRPAELASRDEAKIALKNAVRDWLPGDLLDRKKQGFAMPLPVWLGGDSTLSQTMHSVAQGGPIAEFLDPKRVTDLFRANASGRTSLTGLVYAVFVIDQWFKQWMPT